MIEPLQLSFEVDCPPEHAFSVWTSHIAEWWPKGHTVSGGPVEVVLEGKVGGRIFERTPEGAVHEWGEVTAWEPPTRLAYLWHLRRDRADATEVEIEFLGRDGATTVRIEHTGWERLGAQGPDWRQANQAGWGGLLPHFVSACSL